MIVPNDAIATAVARAQQIRQETGLASDALVVVQAIFEPDWPAEALAQLANRLGEHYIDLEAQMANNPGVSGGAFRTPCTWPTGTNTTMLPGPGVTRT